VPLHLPRRQPAHESVELLEESHQDRTAETTLSGALVCNDTAREGEQEIAALDDVACRAIEKF